MNYIMSEPIPIKKEEEEKSSFFFSWYKKEQKVEKPMEGIQKLNEKYQSILL